MIGAVLQSLALIEDQPGVTLERTWGGGLPASVDGIRPDSSCRRLIRRPDPPERALKNAMVAPDSGSG